MTVKSYKIGFGLSLLLTLVAYFIVVNHIFSGGGLVAAIISLALAQLLVQLIFFLHLMEESRPRWNLVVWISTVGMVLILIIGTLLIMNNLNYRHMSPAETNDYIIHDEGIHK